MRSKLERGKIEKGQPDRTMFEDVFETMPWHLKEQAAQAMHERQVKYPDGNAE